MVRHADFLVDGKPGWGDRGGRGLGNQDAMEGGGFDGSGLGCGFSCSLVVGYAMLCYVFLTWEVRLFRGI